MTTLTWLSSHERYYTIVWSIYTSLSKATTFFISFYWVCRLLNATQAHGLPYSHLWSFLIRLLYPVNKNLSSSHLKRSTLYSSLCALDNRASWFPISSRGYTVDGLYSSLQRWCAASSTHHSVEYVDKHYSPCIISLEDAKASQPRIQLRW